MDILPTRTIEVPDLDQPVRLHGLGDIHIGNRGCAESKLRRDVAAIAADPLAVVLLMGDLGDFISADDEKRWDPLSVSQDLRIEDMADWGGTLVRWVSRELEPLRGKIIGSIEGNHEKSYRKRKQQPVARQMAQEIGAPALGYTCRFILRFTDGRHHRDMKVMATHGNGKARTAGAKLNRLIANMRLAHDADLVLMGHVHDCQHYLRVALTHAGKHLGEFTQNGVITGSYLATYDEGFSGYGEEAGFDPVRLGHPVIEIVPRTLGMSVGWV
jgi:UDP-2,3-diacylglucosamine pyrophosphatase LpxH